jgi:PAS domain S-box-containing protein
MRDQDKTREQLIDELVKLRERVAALEDVDLVNVDMTQQKRAEKALRESEERYRFLAETVPHPMWRCHADGEVIEFNGRWHEYTGQTPDEAKGEGWMKALHPDDMERVSQRSRQAAAAEGVFEAEYRLRRRDGSYRWHLARSLPMKDQDGQVIFRFGSAVDIDDQKRAEEALQASEERYRLLAEAIPHPVWRSDAEGMQIDCNRRWQEYTGQTPEEAQGTGWMKALHPDDVAWAVQRKREDVAGGKLYQAEYRLRRASDGSYRWHLARAIPWRDASGKILGWFGSATDIDYQKQAQEALVEREARLLEAQEVARLGFYVLDIAEGRWTSSSVLDQIFDISTDYERTVGGWDDLVHPDERQTMLHYFSSEVVGERKPFDREYRIVRYGDKEVRWVHGRGRLQFNEAGQPIFMLGTIQDITERKQAEEALQKARDELELRVEERTAELATANEQLAMFRKFTEASGQGFNMADLDGHFSYLNPAFCRLLGLERPEEIVGKHLSICYSEESNRRGNEVIKPALMREGYWEGELLVLSRQGKSIPTWHNTFVIRDERGNPLRVAAVITDITERKRSEEALRASEEKYRGVVEACPDVIVMSDFNGRVLFASPQSRKLFGLADSEELVGRSVFDYVIEKDRQRLAGNLSDLVEVGVRRSTEYTSIRQDGTTIPVDVSSVVIRDAAGQPKVAMAVIRDITQRKRAEEALEREKRTLQHMLRASDHERQLIAYEIHDGLAQELAAAIMQFDAFNYLKETKPKQAADAFHAAMTMLRQGHFEARRLISGVRPPILDEQGVVEAIAHLVHEQARSIGPKIKFDSEVDFDRLAPTLENAIYRITQEGLTNACKHSQSEKVRVNLLQHGDRVRIEIRDWGVGFDPKRVPENRFGMQGIRQRARLLGGKCSIQSATGKGTRISVELPVVERESDQ